MSATRIDSQLDVFQVKIKLEGAPTPIWRRMLIPAAMSLFEVHWTLAEGFGWTGKHIFQFRTSDKRWSLPEMKVDEWLSGPAPLNADKAKLYTVLSDIGATLYWDYNFSEAWTHHMVLEKTRPLKTGDILPWVLDGKMAVPPTGCGGMMSYRDMVKAMVDPTHEERAYWMQWTKGKFDPKAFSPEEANNRMEYMQVEIDCEQAE